jgi:hypothetical protein
MFWRAVWMVSILGVFSCSDVRDRQHGSRPFDPAEIRKVLFEELQPVRLANCELERVGEKHDGGYLMCGNLLGAVKAGYSYGINGYDQWGCDTSRRLGVRVHQYDCFNLTEPACPGGNTVFHAECIAESRFTDVDSRLFDTFENQFARNGDGNRHVVVKIDVEGAEWDVFLRAPDAVLERIDQIAVEFHGVEERKFIRAVRLLKRLFWVAHLHINNVSCRRGVEPFPGDTYEVLFVSKRLGRRAWWGEAARPHSQDAPNDPTRRDCQ